MWKLNRIAQVGLELCRGNPNVNQFKWLDLDIQELLNDSVNGNYKLAFWNGKYYINSKVIDYNNKGVTYIPCASSYNQYILINPDDYPKDIKRFDAFLEWLEKTF